MLYPCGGFVLAVSYRLLQKNRTSSWKKNALFLGSSLILVCISIAVLYSPILRIQGLEALTQNKWVSAQPTFAVFFSDLLENSLRLLDMVFYFQVSWLNWLGACLLVVGLFFSIRLRNQFCILMVASFIFFLGFSLLRKVFPFPRVMIYWVPIILILVSVGWYYLLESRHKFFSFYANVVGLFLVLIGPLIYHDSIDCRETGDVTQIAETVRVLDQLKENSIVLLASPSDFPLLFALRNQPERQNILTSNHFGYGISPTRNKESISNRTEFYLLEDLYWNQNKNKILNQYGLKDLSGNWSSISIAPDIHLYKYSPPQPR